MTEAEVLEELRNILGVNFGERPEKILWAVKELIGNDQELKDRADDAEAERDKIEDEMDQELEDLRCIKNSASDFIKALDDLRDQLQT